MSIKKIGLNYRNGNHHDNLGKYIQTLGIVLGLFHKRFVNDNVLLQQSTTIRLSPFICNQWLHLYNVGNLVRNHIV